MLLVLTVSLRLLRVTAHKPCQGAFECLLFEFELCELASQKSQLVWPQNEQLFGVFWRLPDPALGTFEHFGAALVDALVELDVIANVHCHVFGQGLVRRFGHVGLLSSFRLAACGIKSLWTSL